MQVSQNFIQFRQVRMTANVMEAICVDGCVLGLRKLQRRPTDGCETDQTDPEAALAGCSVTRPTRQGEELFGGQHASGRMLIAPTKLPTQPWCRKRAEHARNSSSFRHASNKHPDCCREHRHACNCDGDSRADHGWRLGEHAERNYQHTRSHTACTQNEERDWSSDRRRLQHQRR